MSNFFTPENSEHNNLFMQPQKEDNPPKENSLDGQYNELKTNYQQIFIEAAESIRKDLDEFKPHDACAECVHQDCKITKKDVFAPYPPSGCKLREWQMQSLTYLTGDYKNKIKAAHKAIMDKKNEYECNCCGACCKLAVSEFSYQQLKQRALRGDKFSSDFVSVFVPYDSEEDAKKINPEYFALLNRLVEDEKIYYYYCSKLGDDNLCTIYEERPDICKSFPHNPLKLLPSECSFNVWKNEVSHQAMLLKAKVDIIGYYKEKLG